MVVDKRDPVSGVLGCGGSADEHSIGDQLLQTSGCLEDPLPLRFGIHVSDYKS